MNAPKMILIALAAIFLAPASEGAPAAADETVAEAGRGFDRAAEIERVEAYLNELKTLKGKFVQIAPDGSLAGGAFYLRRPGRLRFEYDPPHPLLIVSDGTTVAQTDRELETTDRAPLRATPLYFFLKRNVRLSRDTDIARVEKGPAFLAVTARDKDGESDGEVTLVFAQPALELREWIVTDGLGQVTRIVLVDAVRDERLDPRLFLIEDENDNRRRRRR